MKATLQKTGLENEQIEHFDVDEELSRLVGVEEAKRRVRQLVIFDTIEQGKKEVVKAKEWESTKRNKDAFLRVFKEIQVVEAACSKVGIGRTSVYEWLKKDPNFKARYVEVEEERRDFVEDRLIALILKGDGQSIRFWLEKKHPEYAKRLQLGITPEGAQSISKALWEEGRRRYMIANGIQEPKELDEPQHGREPDQQ